MISLAPFLHYFYTNESTNISTEKTWIGSCLVKSKIRKLINFPKIWSFSSQEKHGCLKFMALPSFLAIELWFHVLPQNSNQVLMSSKVALGYYFKLSFIRQMYDKLYTNACKTLVSVCVFFCTQTA
jgi:hypothetical protein